jgi:hypothetical protein
MDVLLDSIGGAAGRVGAGDTAFPHRRALATAQIYQGSASAAAHSAVSEVRTSLGDLFGGSAYVNHIDQDLPNWASGCGRSPAGTTPTASSRSPSRC